MNWQQWTTSLKSSNFKRFYRRLPKMSTVLWKSVKSPLRYSAKILKTLQFLAVAFWWRHKINIIKNFNQFVKISIHGISLPSFIVIWLEIAKLGVETVLFGNPLNLSYLGGMQNTPPPVLLHHPETTQGIKLKLSDFKDTYKDTLYFSSLRS